MELSNELLGAGDLDACARLLAAAMEVDPAYRFLMPEERRRAAGLRAFFAGNLRMHLAHRCVHVVRGTAGELHGTVTLRPPEGIDVSVLTMVRYGLAPFALRHGLGAVKRLVWLKETYDQLEAEASGGKAHSFVHMMAIAPTLQGRGVGTRLLEDVLARADAGVPRVLTTHLQQNVVFYRRAGFRVVGERKLRPPGGDAYNVSSMVRDSK